MGNGCTVDITVAYRRVIGPATGQTRETEEEFYRVGGSGSSSN